MKRKRQFHCEKCGSPCEIYRKGKKHRVLICPECGVLATNPLPLLGLAASLIPKAVKGAVGFVKKMLSGGNSALSPSSSFTPTKAEPPASRQVITRRYDNLDKYNSKDKIDLALR